MGYDSMLETSAVITTILQYLSGAIICKNYIKNKSTSDSSGFPFLCGFLSCSFWLRYGLLTAQSSVVLVNTIGTAFFFLYSMIYYVFTVQKKAYLKQFGVVLLVLVGTVFYTESFEEPEAVRMMGLACCIVTVCFFAAPLTMLIHVIKIKNSESLPFPMIAMSLLVSIQWLIYGILVKDSFIQIPNFLGCVLCLLQLSLFVCYPPKSFNGQGYKLVTDQSMIF